MCKDTESEFIEERVDAVKEAIHFFSNNCKSDREVWVVRHFLSQLCIEFSKGDIRASSDEPVDVVYCDARFQVKEVYDEGRKRGNEYRESLRKAKIATSASDLLEHYSPQKMTCDEVASVVAERASEWQQKYGPSECAATDLLFYFNLQDIHVVGDVLTDVDCYSSKMAAWRSVSVFTGERAFVLYVSETAPGFLKTATGRVHSNLSEY
jgi:hypothetical protein